MNIKRILKYCFWDSNFTEEEILNIATKGSFRQKMFLFNRILENSPNLFSDIKIFSKEDLEKLLAEYKVPNFKQEYLTKRKNLIEVYFFDKPLLIEELKWQV